MIVREGNYYALTLSANGTTSPAYMAVTPTSSLSIAQGGVTIVPTDMTATMVNIYPQSLQIQAPSGMVNAGVTIITNDTHVAGTVQVSPPVDVPVLIQVWGTKLLGSYTLPAGQQTGVFDVPVSADDAIAPDDATKITQRMAQQGSELPPVQPPPQSA